MGFKPTTFGMEIQRSITELRSHKILGLQRPIANPVGLEPRIIDMECMKRPPIVGGGISHRRDRI